MQGIRALAAVTLVGGAALAAGTAAPAQAQAQGSTAEHCYVVLEKVRPGQPEARVKSTECVRAGEQRRSKSAAYLLMIWYQDANYNAGKPDSRVTHFEGDEKCDDSGYGVRTVDYFWRESMSSYKVYSDCNFSKLWDRENYGGTASEVFFGDQGYLGRHNDNVWSLQINRSGQF